MRNSCLLNLLGLLGFSGQQGEGEGLQVSHTIFQVLKIKIKIQYLLKLNQPNYLSE